VLGQIIVVTVLVMTRLLQPSAADLTAGVLSFAIAFEMWWIYVDHVVARALRQGNWWNAVWT
jgi:low temperature requirement protein LtrA